VMNSIYYVGYCSLWTRIVVFSKGTGIMGAVTDGGSSVFDSFDNVEDL
jgi:hypothetical protein